MKERKKVLVHIDPVKQLYKKLIKKKKKGKRGKKFEML